MKLTDEQFEAQYRQLMTEVARFHEVLANGYTMLAKCKCEKGYVQAVQDRAAAVHLALQPMRWVRVDVKDLQRCLDLSSAAKSMALNVPACASAFYEAAQVTLRAEGGAA